MDVSTGGVSCDSGKLVRGGGAPRSPRPRVYQIQGAKNVFSMGDGRAAASAPARRGGRCRHVNISLGTGARFGLFTSGCRWSPGAVFGSE